MQQVYASKMQSLFEGWATTGITYEMMQVRVGGFCLVPMMNEHIVHTTSVEMEIAPD